MREKLKHNLLLSLMCMKASLHLSFLLVIIPILVGSIVIPLGYLDKWPDIYTIGAYYCISAYIFILILPKYWQVGMEYMKQVSNYKYDFSK